MFESQSIVPQCSQILEQIDRASELDIGVAVPDFKDRGVVLDYDAVATHSPAAIDSSSTMS